MVAVAFPGILTVAAGVSREGEGAAAWTKQKKSSPRKMDPLLEVVRMALASTGHADGLEPEAATPDPLLTNIRQRS